MTVLGSATARTTEDPFGPGDPLEVARLVRRALAAARAHAPDVRHVVLMVDAAPTRDASARFVRRALGAHGAAVPSTVEVVTGTDHATRLAHAPVLARALMAGTSSGLVVVVVIGPGATATARCIGGGADQVTVSLR